MDLHVLRGLDDIDFMPIVQEKIPGEFNGDIRDALEDIFFKIVACMIDVQTDGNGGLRGFFPESVQHG